MLIGCLSTHYYFARHRGIGLDPALCPLPTLVIMTKPLVAPPSHVYEEGVTLIIAKTKRNLPAPYRRISNRQTF